MGPTEARFPFNFLLLISLGQLGLTIFSFPP